MKFEASGYLKGFPENKVTIEFNNGELSGDILLLTELEFEAVRLKSLYGGEIGGLNISFSDADMLKNPLAVYLLLHEVCNNLQFRGDIPEIPELEEGTKS